jgi:hypothetical protein
LELCDVPFLDGAVILRLDTEERDREALGSAVVHETGFSLWRAGHIDRDDDRPLQSLGSVNGDERDRILLGVRPPLDLSNGLLPIGTHVRDVGVQTANVVSGGHFKEDVDIGKDAIGTRLETLPELGAYVEEANGVRGKGIRRRRSRSPRRD